MLSRLSKSAPIQGCQFCNGCEQSYSDHTARKLLLGLARQTFRPDYAREEPEWRPVSFLVMSLVGLRRSGSSGSQQNTFSNSGGLDLLHPKVVDLAPPYSQHHAHVLWYTSTLNYNSRSVPGESCSGRLTPTGQSCLTVGNKLKPNELTCKPQRCLVRAWGRLTVTHWLVGYLSAPVAGATKRLPEVRAQLLINPWNMTHTVTYDRVRPLPDVQ